MIRILIATVLLMTSINAYSLSDDSNEALRLFKAGKYKPALKIVVPKAKQGDKEAQYVLGYIAQNGDRTRKPDIKLAMGWYYSAARQNMPDAQFELAQIYTGWWKKDRRPVAAFRRGDDISGIDDNQYLKESLRYYQDAVTNGHPQAGYALVNLRTEVERYKTDVQHEVTAEPQPQKTEVIHTHYPAYRNDTVNKPSVVIEDPCKLELVSASDILNDAGYKFNGNSAFGGVLAQKAAQKEANSENKRRRAEYNANCRRR